MDTAFDDELLYTSETQESLTNTNDSDSFNMNRKSLQAISKKLRKEGYIQGKTDQESLEMQLGFDSGFHRGFILGKISGEVYFVNRIQQQLLQSIYLHDINDNNSSSQEFPNQTMSNLHELLFKIVPESYGIEKSDIEQLLAETNNINKWNESNKLNGKLEGNHDFCIPQSSIGQLTDFIHEMDT